MCRDVVGCWLFTSHTQLCGQRGGRSCSDVLTESTLSIQTVLCPTRPTPSLMPSAAHLPTSSPHLPTYSTPPPHLPCALPCTLPLPSRVQPLVCSHQSRSFWRPSPSQPPWFPAAAASADSSSWCSSASRWPLFTQVNLSSRVCGGWQSSSCVCDSCRDNISEENLFTSR